MTPSGPERIAEDIVLGWLSEEFDAGAVLIRGGKPTAEARLIAKIAQALAAPKVQILHVRDPDSECYLRTWVDGVEVEASVEDIDPGSGWEYEDWKERIDSYEADPPSAFRDAAIEALGDPPAQEYIAGWPKEDR